MGRSDASPKQSGLTVLGLRCLATTLFVLTNPSLDDGPDRTATATVQKGTHPSVIFLQTPRPPFTNINSLSLSVLSAMATRTIEARFERMSVNDENDPLGDGSKLYSKSKVGLLLQYNHVSIINMNRLSPPRLLVSLVPTSSRSPFSRKAAMPTPL
jgi:hypothetical protein